MENKENKHYKYLLLTPKELEVNDTNIQTLKDNVLDKDVKNIAVMASYGAGKSSVLKTFEKVHGLNKCINVSLASFNNDEFFDEQSSNNTESNDKLINDIDNRIEKSILQQILYKKEKKNLPDSQINRIGGLSIKQIVFTLLYVLLGILAVAFGTLFSLQISGIAVFEKVSSTAYFILTIACALFCVIGLVLGRKISRLSYGKIGVDFNLEGKESLLNKFLDEVIYFFQHTNYDTVIFEDLDRFNNLDIFVKLRELNILLNNNDVISKKHKITFVYAVNNGMFKHHTERTKFFDFILPLIPIISPLNVKDDLTESLKESGLGSDWLSQDFIYDISQYIVDKRVLNSIINDCITMLNVLDLSKIPGDNPKKKQEKLFALMAYKNIHPQEFASLENGSGELIDCINYARRLSQNQSQQIDNKIEEKRRLIARCNQRMYCTLEQVKCLIKGYVTTHNNAPGYVQFDIDEIDTIPDDKNKVLACGLNRYRYGASISDIEQGLGIDSLKQLWEDAKLIESNEIYNYNKEIQQLLISKAALTQDGFACLNNYSQEVFIEISPTDLLQMLIVNRYITENYIDYMSRNGEEFLSSNDKVFVKQVVENKAPQFELPLTSPQIIIRDVSDKKFERKAMLNRCIIDTLFSDTSKESSRLRHFCNLLNADDDIVKECIVHYFTGADAWNIAFVKYLVGNRTDLLKLLKDKSLDEKAFGKILMYFLVNIDVADLEKQSNNEVYQEILSQDVSIVSSLNDESKLSFLKKIGFKFLSIDECEDKHALTLIEKYNLWRISEENLRRIQIIVYGFIDESTLSKGWTIIKKMQDHTVKYLQENLTEYISNILLLQPHIDMDATDSLHFSQDENLSLDLRLQIAHNITNSVEFNSYIESDIVKELLTIDKIILNCEEVATLIERDKPLQGLLCDYLFNHHDTVALQFKSLEPVAYLIANCHKEYLKNGENVTLYDIYKENLATFNWKIIKLDNDEIMERIVRANSSFTVESMKCIVQGNYPKSLIALVENNIDSLIANNLVDYKVALCYFLSGKNSTKKISAVLMEHLIKVNKDEDARLIFEQAKHEKINLPRVLCDKLICAGIDAEEVFDSQVEFLSKEEALSWAAEILPDLAQLQDEGSINGTFELNDDIVVQALLRMNYAHRRGNGLRRYKIEVS